MDMKSPIPQDILLHDMLPDTLTPPTDTPASTSQHLTPSPILPSRNVPFKKKVASSLLEESKRLEADMRLAHMVHSYIIPFFEDVLSGKYADASPELRYKVSQDVMNRHLGKPKETVDMNTQVTLKIDV